MLLHIFYSDLNDIPLPPSSTGQVLIVAMQNDIRAHSIPRPASSSAPQSKQLKKNIDKHRRTAVAPHALYKQQSHAVTPSKSSQQLPSTTAPKTWRNTTTQSVADHDAKQTATTVQVTNREQRLLRLRRYLEHFKYYPASARRRGIEGEVEVAFDLDARGMANRLRLLSRSGYRILDRAALETVRRASPFPIHSGHYRFQLVFKQS